jgi:hypothetical protein
MIVVAATMSENVVFHVVNSELLEKKLEMIDDIDQKIYKL